jgi:hypothetical protein
LIEEKEHSLRIYMPVTYVTWAFEHGDDNNPFVDDINDFKRNWKVTNKKLWAKDVFSALRLVLLDEEEDGSSQFTRLMDKAFIRAIEDGSSAVEEDGRLHKELAKDGVRV